MLFIKRIHTISIDETSREDLANKTQDPDDITFFAVRITPVHNGDKPFKGKKLIEKNALNTMAKLSCIHSNSS